MNLRLRPAQSLLEAIIAIGVILVATISSSTLVVTTITSGRVSADKIQAANFAREGVEVVREIRDSNWMKRAQNVCDGSSTDCQNGTATTVQWDDTGRNNDGYSPLGTAVGKCYHTIYDINVGWYLTLDFNTACTATIPAAARINDVIDKNNQTDADQRFFTSDYCPAGWRSCQPTKYSRQLSIIKVNEASAGDYLDVTSTITWNNHGDKSLSVTERLYDWR